MGKEKVRCRFKSVAGTRVYTSDGVLRSKREANRHAKLFRKDGFYARVIPSSGSYLVYTRRKLTSKKKRK